jgi:hypothetical protein
MEALSITGTKHEKNRGGGEPDHNQRSQPPRLPSMPFCSWGGARPAGSDAAGVGERHFIGDSADADVVTRLSAAASAPEDRGRVTIDLCQQLVESLGFGERVIEMEP